MSPTPKTVTINFANITKLLYQAQSLTRLSLKELDTTETELKEKGIQEIKVVVKGGYDPDTIVVKKGIPVRLYFYRDETADCSDTIVFGDFKIRKALPAFKTTPIEFTPEKEGEYVFTCGMGMMRGKLVVR